MNDDNPITTPLNFAMLYYMNLTERIKGKDDAYMQNDIYGYCKGLDRIYHLMYFKIEEDDKKVEDGKEKIIPKLEEWFKTAEDNLRERKPKAEIVPLLKNIEKELMVLMHRYKMIFPNMDSAIGLAKQYNRYNLSPRKDNGTS